MNKPPERKFRKNAIFIMGKPDMDNIVDAVPYFKYHFNNNNPRARARRNILERAKNLKW